MFNLPEKEQEILKFWQEKNIFKKTLAQEAPKGDFIFYEGPPTANGKPGIHHVEARAFKDVIPRFKTMNGFRVERKAGWDTHGLPVELEVEKKLGLKNKKEVEAYGIKEFNEKCKESVWQYVNDWEKMTERIGFWIDMEHPYITYHNDYIETLWWIIKQAHEQGLMYQGHKVIPQCPRCGTALSSHEVAQGYKNVKEESVYIKFKLKDEEIKKLRNKEIKGKENVYILAWTTTPWTLPGNVALAVGEDIKYSVISNKEQGESYILASDLVEKVLGDKTTGSFSVVQDGILGSDLVGLEYEPLFPGVIKGDEKNAANAFKVYGANFVSTEDGTGVVHTAVMYGLEDYELGEEIGLPKVHTVNLDGTFNKLVPQWQGRFVKDCDKEVIADLKVRNVLFRTEEYAHDYPFCWRCDTPLIYYAKDSWFFKMSALREEMIKSNEKINWVPEHIKEGRFGEWLKEVKDWAISRERYWGTPLPVWKCHKCDHIKVVGSYEELPVFQLLKNTYYLLRHGQAENNVQDILCSKLENDRFHLTELGRQQIEQLMPYFIKEKIDVIIHSPFIRTTETATMVAEKIGLRLERSDLLWELGLGLAEGKDNHAFTELAGPLAVRLKNGVPGGESVEEIRERMAKFVKETEEKYQGKKILVVSHGDPLAQLISLLTGKDSLEVWQNNYLKNGESIKFTKAFKHQEWQKFDPHRPFIDEIKFKCDKCEGEMTRVSEVMDCWFDSGAMPLAQDHYPFEVEAGEFELSGRMNANLKYPAEFISEAIDQTRGWFYTLLAVATLIGRETPYKNVICLGHVLDKNGQKMSKHVGNVVDPWKVIEKYGADVVRWYLYTVNQPGDPKRFDESFLKEAGRMFNTLFNVLTFYQTYKEKEIEKLKAPLSSRHGGMIAEATRNKEIKGNELTNVLDKWIAAKLDLLIKEVTAALESYDLFTSGRKIEEFINDLSIWYVRRSRERFKSENIDDKNQAVFTLGKVLFELTKILAPFIPFSAEYIYQELGKNCGALKESVHLEEWPMINEKLIEQSVLDNMSLTRQVVEMGLAKRAEAGIKVRQPLNKFKIQNPKLKIKEEYLNLIRDEINVKEIGQEEGQGELAVELDTEITEELKEEGILRELVRTINNLRKESGLTIADRIKIYYQTDDELVKRVLEKYAVELRKQTLADELINSDGGKEVKINEIITKLKVEKV
ncbi:MAG TPA: class I tRNA ligase family protein [bacterium]|nr:class I tRNA ligase family protein [bacterium]HPL95813.1 class I tRNA ligase family protein [bacterium]